MVDSRKSVIKFITAFFITMIMICCIEFMTTNEAYASLGVTGSCGGSTTWVYDYDNRLLVIMGSGSTDDFDLDYQGHNAPWLSFSSDIREIIIAPGVTRIGGNAFYDCANVKSTTIADTVKTIGSGAYQHCSGLDTINIPNSVTQIEPYAFAGCRGLENVSLPQNLTKIDEGLFTSCDSLSTITLPQRVMQICKNAFRNCPRLYEINLPSGLTFIDGYSFQNCSSLKRFEIPSGITQIAPKTFEGCTSLSSLVVPKSVTRIENGSIPQTATIIGWNGSAAISYAMANGLKFQLLDPPTKKDISKLQVLLSTNNFIYDGRLKVPRVSISGLTQNTDYTVSYYNNINPGLGTVTITGIGAYSGSTSAYFNIAPKSISAMSVYLSPSSYTYDGSAKTPLVSISGLSNGIDYTVTYNNNIDAGIATVTITGKGLYAGTIVEHFKIKPDYAEERNKRIIQAIENTNFAAIRATKGKGIIRVSWSKAISPYNVNGYEVYRSTQKYNINSLVKTTKHNYIRDRYNLRKGRTYYYKVRGYRFINNETYYTNWSRRIAVKAL